MDKKKGGDHELGRGCLPTQWYIQQLNLVKTWIVQFCWQSVTHEESYSTVAEYSRRKQGLTQLQYCSCTC